MPKLMIQGCTSDAGKSTLVTAICRLLERRGVKVAPFKPQNMALNSAVTADGGEIGRAQAVQAAACRIPAHTDHNPVLLKPTADCTAQVIIHGRAIGNLSAIDYHAYKQQAKAAVFESWQRLEQGYQAVVVEGAGSPAEINLREGDIANMGFAEEADCPVWLVADIDRGGVFAHFVGTLACLSESEQARIQGFIINRFRGDLSLLQPGIDWLEAKTGKPVLAVLPYLHGLDIAAEDALPPATSHNNERKVSAKPSPEESSSIGRLPSIPTPPALSLRGGLATRELGGNDAPFRVIVPALPHIANHSDFDPFLQLDGVDFRFVGPGQAIVPADLIILPGSKNTRGDVGKLFDWGWDKAIARHLRYGGKVIGVCGGYQMLGEVIADPHGIEGEPGSTQGLGLLPVSTVMAAEKTLRDVGGTLSLLGRTAAVRGYEIHHGETAVPTSAPLQLDGQPDGALSGDGLVLGSYLHGIFDEPAALNLILEWAGCDSRASQRTSDILDAAIDRLTDALEITLDLDRARSAGLPLP